MSEDCVAGDCARQSFDESRQPLLPEGVGFTAIYSRRDGIVDWRACVDPARRAPVEVTRVARRAWPFDPRVIDVVLGRAAAGAGAGVCAQWSKSIADESA